jgi:hypothetical protein
MPTNDNPYAAPIAPVADMVPAEREKPTRVTHAVALLWIAYVLSVVHVGLALGYLSRLFDMRSFVPLQSASFLFYALLIYSISKGRNWARVTYLILMGVRVMTVTRMFPRDLQTSKLAVVVTVISLMCQCVALYWLYTEPGRLWFRRPG